MAYNNFNANEILDPFLPLDKTSKEDEKWSWSFPILMANALNVIEYNNPDSTKLQ